MRIPINKIKKDDLVWLNDNYCKHGHTYLSHYQCYLDEKPDAPFDETIGILDIETTSLNAVFGYVLSWCIADMDGTITHEACITAKEIRSYQFDKRVVEDFVKVLPNYDRLVVHYGKDRRHDIPFMRTRALYWGIPFPGYAEHRVTDTWDIMKNKLNLHSRRLQAICDFLEIPSKEHKLDGPKWMRAQAGDQDALNWIMEHNREDVISTLDVYNRIRNYIKEARTSF